MFTIDRTVDIAAPAEIVWEVLTDFGRYHEWNPFVVDCRVSALEPGATIDMQVKLVGKPQFQREWIREVQPGKGFAYSMKPVPLGTLRSLRTHRLEALGKDRCRYHSHFELDGWLKPVVLALFRGALQRGFGGMTDAIRTRAESLAQQRRARPAA